MAAFCLKSLAFVSFPCSHGVLSLIDHSKKGYIRYCFDPLNFALLQKSAGKEGCRGHKWHPCPRGIAFNHLPLLRVPNSAPNVPLFPVYHTASYGNVPFPQPLSDPLWSVPRTPGSILETNQILLRIKAFNSGPSVLSVGVDLMPRVSWFRTESQM